jgi:glycosyltransferase involved in cell wall biosynthesis
MGANLPGSVLVLIGSDFNSYAEETMVRYESLRNSASLSRVLFLEKISREETFSAYRACDVFLLAARAETQPIVIIEAMAAGKPWISTNTGCVSELSGGIVCNSPTELTVALRALISDSQYREDLAHAGREAAKSHHDVRRAVGRYHRIFSDVVTPAN